MNTIAERIVHRRKELGLTQKQLAELLHVSDKTVSRWETDKQIPDALTMQAIAAVLGISIAELYGDEQGSAAANDDAVEKQIPYKKIIKIFCLAFGFAVVILLVGMITANRELNAKVSCQIDEFPMYMLTGHDQSIVEWVDYCDRAGEELSHLSALGGETAYYLFYLPRGSEETKVDYSYRDGLRGRVLTLNFRNVSEHVDAMYYLCYMKFPCEDSIILKTYIDGEAVNSYAAYAMFTGLCENILFK